MNQDNCDSMLLPQLSRHRLTPLSSTECPASPAALLKLSVIAP